MSEKLVPGVESKLTTWGYIPLSDGYSTRPLTEAVALYQANHAAGLNDDCHDLHNRGLHCDGDIGPATAATMNTRLCDCPDMMPGEAREAANWPKSCRDNITLSWNYDALPGLTREETDAVMLNSKREYEQYFEMRVVLAKNDYPNTRVYKGLKALPGPPLAWSYLATNNCNARLQQAFDNTITWSFNLACGTDGHENGHVFGMNHTPQDRRSLMYPSMNGQTKLNQTDINQMVRLGYVRRKSDPDLGWGMF